MHNQSQLGKSDYRKRNRGMMANNLLQIGFIVEVFASNITIKRQL